MQKSVMEQPSSSYQRRCSINRFGYGISEGCNSGLFLPTIDSILDQKSSITTTQVHSLTTFMKKYLIAC